MRLARILFALGTLVAVPTASFAEDADAYYKQGLAYKQQGKNDDAISALEKAVAANPKHGMAWSSLGNLYKAKGDNAKAVDAYEKATAVIKKDKVLWSNLGMAYYRAGEKLDKDAKARQLDKAIAALEEAKKP